MRRWLKKYMKIEHLEQTLVGKKLHLGNPHDWPDKNDSEVIEMYRTKKNLTDIGATCLTMAPDRNHFWELFGERELGVCLWFDRSLLLKDIEKDHNLRGDFVTYYTTKELAEKCNFADLPFVKRKQYADEQEYRVVREYQLHSDVEDRGIDFNIQSLKKIYFNCWLEQNAYQLARRKIENLDLWPYDSVVIEQNQTIRFAEWIDAAKKVR